MILVIVGIAFSNIVHQTTDFIRDPVADNDIYFWLAWRCHGVPILETVSSICNTIVSLIILGILDSRSTISYGYLETTLQRVL